MLVRWLIRSFFIVLLTTACVAWAGSYFRRIMFEISFTTHAEAWTLDSGVIVCDAFPSLPASRGHWEWRQTSADRKDVQRAYKEESHFLGFAYHAPTASWNDRNLMIPLWCPTLLSAIALWVAWRKTRLPTAGTRFPVTVAAKA